MVVTAHEYLPFGEDWITEGDTKNAPKYNSQELDKESGYYFYNARHYDPEIARFITPDTVIDGEYSTQGWNRFAYCKGNPIIYKDPTGHSVSGSWSSGASGSWTEGGTKSSETAAMKQDASKLVNKMFDKAVKDCKNLTGGARFKGVVDNLTEQFKSVKYKNEDQLAYTFASLMGRMGKEFGAGGNHIKYGFADPNRPLYETGSMRQTEHVDCTNYQTIGINILGLTKPGGETVSERYPSKYKYADSSYANGPKNFMDNKSVFRKVNSNSDLTGTIGLWAQPRDKGPSHAFASLNSDSSNISESEWSAGIRNTSVQDTINLYKGQAEFYRLRLPSWKQK